MKVRWPDTVGTGLAKRLVGKRIEAIHVERTKDKDGHAYWDVISLALEDGTKLMPHTMENEDGYGTILVVGKR